MLTLLAMQKERALMPCHAESRTSKVSDLDKLSKEWHHGMDTGVGQGNGACVSSQYQ